MNTKQKIALSIASTVTATILGLFGYNTYAAMAGPSKVSVIADNGQQVSVASQRITFKPMSGKTFGTLHVLNSTMDYRDQSNKPLVVGAEMTPGYQDAAGLVGKTIVADVTEGVYVNKKTGKSTPQHKAVKVISIE